MAKTLTLLFMSRDPLEPIISRDPDPRSSVEITVIVSKDDVEDGSVTSTINQHHDSVYMMALGYRCL